MNVRTYTYVCVNVVCMPVYIYTHQEVLALQQCLTLDYDRMEYQLITNSKFPYY